MRLLLCSFLTLVLCYTQAQSQFSTGPSPSWVEEFSYERPGNDTTITTTGYRYLLINRQYHLDKAAGFRKFVVEVTSEQGLTYASAINVSFDPYYQRLTFHSLVIHRNGKVLNKLDKNKFELLRREEAMDRLVYDKSLSAVYNIPDVRPGDIIEYAYSIEGRNPVFGTYDFGEIYLNYSDPVARQVVKLIRRSSEKVNTRQFISEYKSTEKIVDGYHHIIWDERNIDAIIMDDMTPSWFDAYPRLAYSDFNSWEEVQAWAEPIYRISGHQSDEISNLLFQIDTLHDETEKIAECIRFVQGQIRYLSFSDGVHSHKPHDPNKVVEQKFGDCKDKSLLLVYLLTKLGVESYPAFVSTTAGRTLPEHLPNPYAFNHCIVKFSYQDSTYWIDPTLNPQVGGIKNFYFPDYKNALVIGGPIKGLEPIAFGMKNSSIDVLEEYFIDTLGSNTTLKVKTIYSGDEADNIRSWKNNNSMEHVHSSYLNFYANDYPEIERSENITFADDVNTNTLTSFETYTIKNLWSYDSVTGKNRADFYARIISSYLSKPTTKSGRCRCRSFIREMSFKR